MTTELLERSISGDDPQLTVASTSTTDHDGWVLMRLDTDDNVAAAVPYALAIADGLGRRLRLIRVVNSYGSPGQPTDPIEWDLRRREASLQLECLAARYSSERSVIDYRVLKHFTPAEAGGVAEGEKPVIGFIRHNGRLPWHLDVSSRRFIENHGCSILLVPDDLVPVERADFSRVLVPLDGSPRAEAAAAAGRRIAMNHGVELHLVHVISDVQLTGNGVLDAEGVELRHRVMQRNKRVAKAYLERVGCQHAAGGVNVRTHLFEGEDVRRRLLALARQQPGSLIVLAAHGCGGHIDVPAGSIASFILEHASMPVLMIGPQSASGRKHLYSDTITHGVRLPADSHSAG